MRLIVQSSNTGRFLCPSTDDGAPCWVRSLRDAGGGVSDDFEALALTALDMCDSDDAPIFIDLDRLGTPNDYPL